MLYQRTLHNRITVRGVGLHSGRAIEVALLPAAPNTGIVFYRTDAQVEIPARVSHVVETRLATTLGKGGVQVGTVEHLMAALYGLGVDNARIELDGPEVPIVDGSAAPFVEAIQRGGGTVAQSRPKRFLVLKRPVEVVGEDRIARLEPAESFQLDCFIDFPHPLVSRQHRKFVFSDRAFLSEIARARTFGFGKDIDAMHQAGLALGGSLDNAVVIDDFSVRNPEGLRFPDEFVRHKILDAIGDLALLGAPIVGRYVGRKAGHALNAALVESLLAQPRAFEWGEFRNKKDAVSAGVQVPAFRLA